MLVARVCAHTDSFTSILPVLLSFQILLPYPPLPSRCPPLTTTSVVAAGGEPGRSWTAARRPHRGPRAEGDPARGAAPEAGPGSPAPRPARPNPQCAVRWHWHGGQGQWAAENGRDGVCRLGEKVCRRRGTVCVISAAWMCSRCALWQRSGNALAKGSVLDAESVR